MVETTQLMSQIGDKVSMATQWALNLLSDMGIFTSPTTAKILTILIILFIVLIILSVFSSMKKPIKYAIIALSILLVVSVITSF